MERLNPTEQHLFDCLRRFLLTHQLSPTIEELSLAMNERSRSKVQEILESLRQRGHITWKFRQARSYQILVGLIPLQGSIQAGQVVEHLTDCTEYIELPEMVCKPEDYALRVCGDSMIDAHICDRDIVIVRPTQDQWTLKRDAIAAVWVHGEGATLKYVEFDDQNGINLKPANAGYPTRRVSIDQVEIQGIVISVHRSYLSS
ncbi:MAG: transcriptional repressor LexA [Phormidesmis sp. CAN_BIN36]|nr:transcriptional repressor LexA [Phormidesmis sp. CAN_BIN36]